MATYVLPQVLVFQEFNIVPTADLRQLNAFIAGGHAYLSRLSESDEKALAYIGIYDDTGVAVLLMAKRVFRTRGQVSQLVARLTQLTRSWELTALC